eukprot:763910-Pleurochrysis_carterae.AAC.1
MTGNLWPKPPASPARTPSPCRMKGAPFQAKIKPVSWSFGAGAMVAELPILKLFFLGVRQIAKPIANRQAKDSATFKSGTVAVGRALHRLQQQDACLLRVQIQVGRLADGKGSLAHITPLNEVPTNAIFSARPSVLNSVRSSLSTLLQACSCGHLGACLRVSCGNDIAGSVGDFAVTPWRACAGTTVVAETMRASSDKRKKEAAENAAEMERRAKIDATEKQLREDLNELGKRITSLSDQVWYLQKQQSVVEEKHRNSNRSWSEWITGN